VDLSKLNEEVAPADWNSVKRIAQPKNKALKQFNSYLEEVRGKLARHYRELQMKGEQESDPCTNNGALKHLTALVAVTYSIFPAYNSALFR
jgi:hypothetical protein